MIKSKSLLSFFILWAFITLNSRLTEAQSIYPIPKSYILGQPSKFPVKCLKLTHEFQLLENTNLQHSQFQYYLEKIQTRQRNLSDCSSSQQYQKLWAIIIKEDPQLVSKAQGYKIISTEQNCTIYIREYSGYVYAMEVVSQLIGENQISLGVIEDQPLVEYRGIMIDSVRHFISYSYIVKLIESMPLARLNMLHWHLSDDQAFVLQLITHPQLAQSGSYDRYSFYTEQQMKDLLNLAQKNAVNIIPQFDSPAHIRSWGLSQKWKSQNITILCPGGQHYNHQFDLSKQEVYTLASQVLKEVDNFFIKSPYLHLGGDQTSSACWDLRPAIKTFMKLKNIKNYDELQMYWRYHLKQSIPSSRKVIFWLTRSENITTGPQDIVQYWGKQSETASIVGKSQSKIILSPSDIIYLNEGQSFIWENQTFGRYFTWKNIYQNFTVFPEGIPKERILGAETCLWGEVSNEDTLENNLWPRATAFGFKVWSSSMMSNVELIAALKDVNKVLQTKGVQPSPIVSEICEVNPKFCDTDQ